MKKLKTVFIIGLPIWAFLLSHILVHYNNMPICLWKNIFHTNCLGCGMTRAFYALCNFDFNNAWHYNSRIYIILPILFYVWIREIIKVFKQN